MQLLNGRRRRQSIIEHIGLPNELLQFIFSLVPRSNLGQMALVSKQWNAVASPLLYRHIYIRTLVHWWRFVACCSGKIASQPPPWLASSVTSLVLRPSPRLMPRSTCLQLSHGLVTDRAVEDQGYVRIHPVDLDNTGLEFIQADNNDDENYSDMDTTIKEAEWLTNVTDMDMAKVITQCPQLVYLLVSGCTQIGEATMYALASSATSSGGPDYGRASGMKGLWLDLTRQISTIAWMTFVHAEQKRLTLHTESSSSRYASQQYLHHLDLSYCGFVTDACLTKSLPLWSPSLTHLRLCSLYNITDDTVQAIAKHCPHLRLLHLSRCFKITNHSIIQMAASPLRSSLVYLSLAFLNQINELGIKPLVYACEHLKVLDISGTGINPMFKQIIIQQWDQARQQKNWGEICYQEEPVLLL